MRFALFFLIFVLLFGATVVGSAFAHKGASGHGPASGGARGSSEGHSKHQAPSADQSAVQALKQAVQSSSAPKGDVESLTHKLDAIQVSLEKGDFRAAANKVEAFIHELEAQHKAGRLSDALFNSLLSQAQQLRAALEGQVRNEREGHEAMQGQRDANGQRPERERLKEGPVRDHIDGAEPLKGIGDQVSSFVRGLSEIPRTFGDAVLEFISSLFGRSA